MIRVYSEYTLGDMTARYLLDGATQEIGWSLTPTAKLDDIRVHREDLSDVKELAALAKALPVSLRSWCVQPVVEFSLAADVKADGWSQGQTMRRGQASRSMRFVGQESAYVDGVLAVVTETRSDPYGLAARHFLCWTEGGPFLTTWTEIENHGSSTVSLEMLTSFNLGYITPFDECDATERLFVHRLRSAWAAEGRHDVQSIEQLELERSWTGHGFRCERFGMIGTKPTRRWFPFLAIEDREAGVFWGAQLAWGGSWQMEICRRDDFLTISGGLADREFGHWLKHLAPGETIGAPKAFLSTTDKCFDSLCSRLTAVQQPPDDATPVVERELPVLFNEWCASWGRPTHDSLVQLAKACKHFGCSYLVIDAGWYANESGQWDNTQGDWRPSPIQFPHGLETACSEIRQAGIVPGLWFELEVAGTNSLLWYRADLLLHRDGVPVEVGSRRFLDMRNPAVHEYLEEHVLELIDRCDVGYVKIDQNETIGLGVDGAESLGEALRQHVEGVHRFFDRMRQRFPELVVENCSSGGQRMELSFIMRSDMTSFSDAHETTAIPIVAANVQRVLHPGRSQVWCVLRAGDDERRLVYGLAATFLGRLCLSGDLIDLDEQQLRIVKEAVALYRESARTIRSGVSERFGPPVASYNAPSGWQAVRRYGEATGDLLIVAHSFGNAPATIDVPLPNGSHFQTHRILSDSETRVRVGDTSVRIEVCGDFAGCVVLLQRE